MQYFNFQDLLKIYYFLVAMSNGLLYLNCPVFSTFTSLPSLKIPKEGLPIWLRVQHLPSVCKALESILGVLPQCVHARVCARARVRAHTRSPKEYLLMYGSYSTNKSGKLKIAMLCIKSASTNKVQHIMLSLYLLQFFMLLLSMGPYVSPPLKPKKKGIRFTSDRFCYLLYMGQQSRCFSISWSLFPSSRGMLIWN